MRFALALTLIILANVFHTQTVLEDSTDVIVVKFSCGLYQTGSGMIRSVQEPDPPNNEPFRINQTLKNEPQESINRRDMQERRAEMVTAERNASLSTQPPSKIYFYRLRVKNASSKVVKSFAWEYQPLGEPDPSNRQFFCYVKAKPSEAKDMELYTPLAPSRVVDASKAGQKSPENTNARVVINKIEYLDGTFWKRPAWDVRTFSDDATQKVAPGKCIGL
jgi:hypothetical protein